MLDWSKHCIDHNEYTMLTGNDVIYRDGTYAVVSMGHEHVEYL